MDFLTAPLIVGIVFAAIYGLFELFVRRNERLAIIEKIGDKLDASAFEGKLGLPSYLGNRLSFSSLKAGCLLTGIGLGLLVGFIISTSFGASGFGFMNNGWRDWYHSDVSGTIYGASVLLFGGIGLLVSFVIEMKMGKNNDK